MSHRRLTLFATTLCVSVLLVGQAAGQMAAAPRTATAKKPYSPARLADGHPDLQGTYDLATLTPMERPVSADAASPVLSREAAAKLEDQARNLRRDLNQPIDPDRKAPPKGGDGSVGAKGNVGGYNNFWLDPGSSYTVVDGQKRSSLIIDPPSGRVPAYTAAARQRMAREARPSSDATESSDPGLEKEPGAYDDPERRPLGERCLLGFGSTSGPPALPNYFYNNLHKIVQTPDTVVIHTEMVHDARVVRMNAQHLPKSIRKWLGDSVGHWEGDTLVVDTTNFSNKTRFRGATENLHVVERFTRTDDRTLLYRFTIEDPATWDRAWTGEYSWPATNQPIYEYACHEGNYAMGGILSGARQRERDTGR